LEEELNLSVRDLKKGFLFVSEPWKNDFTLCPETGSLDLLFNSSRVYFEFQLDSSSCLLYGSCGVIFDPGRGGKNRYEARG
jgi:hypothetical protein